MQQKDNDQFSFINEKIKEKPVNKKRLLMQAGFIALMAVVFGIIASLVFAYFQPKFESLFCPDPLSIEEEGPHAGWPSGRRPGRIRQ